MTLSVHPAPRARARDARSMFSDRRTGRNLLTAFVLARMSLLVLTGVASVNAVCGSHDRHRVDHRVKVGRRLDVVLAGSTGVDTASTPSDDATLQQQRMASSCPLVQQECTVARGAVDRSRAPGRQVSPAVLPQQESTAARDHIGSLDSPLPAEEGRLVGVRRAGSAAATQTMSGTLVAAGLFGLLGVCGAATSIVHSATGPVRRAVRVLQAPEKGRLGHRLRRTTLHEFRDMSRALPGTRSAVTVIASLVEQAQLVALDATIESARSGGADTGSAVIAPKAAELAEGAAKAVEAVTAASPPAASPVATTRYAAARSRALGPTTALWHAVELDRLVGAFDGACETTVCGSLVRVSREQRWPVPARDVCPACSTLAH